MESILDANPDHSQTRRAWPSKKVIDDQLGAHRLLSSFDSIDCYYDKVNAIINAKDHGPI